jgi:hypothetical protein
MILIGLVCVPIFLFLGWNPDARFESSDGMWHDVTGHLKGRGFDTITFDFDDYRLKCHRPSVTLVRTTRVEAWNVVGWPWYLTASEWRAPYGARRTCLVERCRYEGFPDCTGKGEPPNLREMRSRAAGNGS